MAITKTRSIYYIKDNELHYVNDLREIPREWHRGPIPKEIIDILTKKRVIRFNDNRKRRDVWVFENELESINEWIRRYNDKFIMNPYYKKPIVRSYGEVPNFDEHPELDGEKGCLNSKEYMHYILKNYETNLYLCEDGFTPNKKEATIFETFSQAELERKKNNYLVTVLLKENTL